MLEYPDVIARRIRSAQDGVAQMPPVTSEASSVDLTRVHGPAVELRA